MYQMSSTHFQKTRFVEKSLSILMKKIIINGIMTGLSSSTPSDWIRYQFIKFNKKSMKTFYIVFKTHFYFIKIVMA